MPDELKTLGWEILDLADDLIVPSGSLYGRPLTLTDEQASFMLRWYAVDAFGRYLFRRAGLRRPKGWGKSPFAAFWAYCELVGPVLFDGWDAQGDPVGRPHPSPWVQIAAVSEDQTDNTYVALYEMLRDSPALDIHRLDVGITRIHKIGQPGRIEPVSAAAGSREGQPLTAAVLDQTESWTKTNGGVRLAATLRRNAAKMGGRTWETPNAHTVGDGSVAEQTYKAWERGAPGLLYDFREPRVEIDLTDAALCEREIIHVYGDSIAWNDPHRLVLEVQDPSTDPGDALKFYFNVPSSGANRAVDMRRWGDLVDVRIVEPGARIALGFDGSISNDATVLWGCTADGFLFEIAAWERPATAPRSWRVPRSEVHDTLAEVMSMYAVGLMHADPPLWQSELEEWARLYGEDTVLAYPTYVTTRFAPACDRFVTAVNEGTLRHDGSKLLTRHLGQTARRQTRQRDETDDTRIPFVFVKAGTAKIDASVAAVLAFDAAASMAVVSAPASSKAGPAPTGSIFKSEGRLNL